MSLVDGDFIAKKIRDAIMGKLNTIKTNFSNKFKDLENISDNEQNPLVSNFFIFVWMII